VIDIKSHTKSRSISAVVTRANGSVEDLGVVAYWHKNPLKRLAVNIYIAIKERLRAW
jgi:hypothetical protein